MSKVLLGFVVLHLHIIEVYYYVSILSSSTYIFGTDNRLKKLCVRMDGMLFRSAFLLALKHLLSFSSISLSLPHCLLLPSLPDKENKQ